jgi:RNA exonuclease 4
MVGIGEMGFDNMIARVSIVNQLGECLYDKYVKPAEPVIDYRTPISGVTAEHLQNGLFKCLL